MKNIIPKHWKIRKIFDKIKNDLAEKYILYM